MYKSIENKTTFLLAILSLLLSVFPEIAFYSSLSRWASDEMCK